ncbi:MAG: hypothetical protein EXS37_21655 [Opitutus sp.]|nr:hypothetical protein [Opitutus sp.]
MSTGGDDPDSEGGDEKSYRFVWRFIVFVVIAGPASVFAFGIYGRIAMRNSITAAAERGDYSPMIILTLWLIGLVGTAVMIFKK